MKYLSNRGSVIVAALWMCMSVSWIGLMTAYEARSKAGEVRTGLERRRALYVAVSGCNEALARIVGRSEVALGADPGEGWFPDGGIHVIPYPDGGKAEVAVEDEREKFDINAMDEIQLERVLESAGYAETAGDLAAGLSVRLGKKPPGLGFVTDDLETFSELTSLGQLLHFEEVDPDLFYGNSPFMAENNTEEGRLPLFSLLTVHNGRTDADALDGASEIPGEGGFRSGGIYRIISRGGIAGGSAPAAVCLIVKYTPGSGLGYQVLQRNVI